jgi:hypothetical protein
MAVSKAVANWGLIVRTVVTAIRHFGPEFAVQLERELFPDGVPERLTMALVLMAFADALERRLESARDTDEALTVERADDEGFRHARDDAWSKLRALIMRSHASVEGGYGTDASVRVGLDGRLADDPDELVAQGRAASTLMTPDNLGERAAPVPGVSIDAAQLAAAFRAAADLLDGSLIRLRADAREDQDALGARDKALSLLSSGYTGVANIMVGVALFLGRPDVADRVRVTAARRAGRPEAEDLSAGGTDPATDPDASEGGGTA